MLLAGKVVAVSGVGPGLGRAMALEAAAEGAKVVCIARSRTVIDTLVAELREAGVEALAVTADVGSAEDCASAATAIEQRFGRLDGLINSAFSVGAIGSIEETDLDEWRNAFDVNVFGMLHLVRATAGLLRGGGVILNVNTASALRPMQSQGAYGASKAAMEFLTRQLAIEFGPGGVRCNTVYCGPMAGPSLDLACAFWADQRGQTVEEVCTDIASNMALKRVPTDAEVAKTIVMLLSDGASAMTGAAVEVTAGFGLEQRI